VQPLYEGASSVTLESGLRVLVEEAPSSSTVSAGVWIGGGSRSDPEDQPGLAHAIEHLLFKGSSARTATEIACEIEAVGGHINAATGRESTLVYAEAPAASLGILLDVLADVVQHPAFAAAELERERGVLLEEIRNHDDDPEQRAHDLFAEGLWDPPHPLGRSVLGSLSTVHHLSRDRVAEHHLRQYVPANMVVVVCGAVSTEEILRTANRCFDDGARSMPPPCTGTPPSMHVGKRVYRLKAAQSHIYLALPGPPACDADRFALEVLNGILGDGLSSRLFQRIREERGLAYVVSSAVSRYRDTGVWTFYAGVAPRNVSQVEHLIVEELRSVLRDGVGEDEIHRAKSRLCGHLLLSLESNGSRMVRLGNAALAGCEILSPEQVIEQFDHIDAQSLERAIARFVRPEAAHLARIGSMSHRIAGRRTDR